MREDCSYYPWRAKAKSPFDEWIEPAVVEWMKMTRKAEHPYHADVDADSAAAVVVVGRMKTEKKYRDYYCCCSRSSPPPPTMMTLLDL